MQVPIGQDGLIAVASDVSVAGNYVELRAERDVIAVLSNCPQMHNPCNGFNPTPMSYGRKLVTAGIGKAAYRGVA